MDYVYTYPSIPAYLCKDIIQKYEDEIHLKYEGLTAKGLDKNVKDTQDMMIPDNEEWNEVNQFLHNELQKNIKQYMHHIEKGENYKKDNNFGSEYNHLHDTLEQVNHFMIQKYEEKKGKYIYHEDSFVEAKKSRVITYLWYLNDVVEGGETEFFGGTFKIKPEEGKLLLFPACWCYPHRGNVPISSCKYIITGWLYKKHIPSKEIIPTLIVNSSSPLNEDKEETLAIFNYFYKVNLSIFMNYKKHKQTGSSIFNNLSIATYTTLQNHWLLHHIQDIKDKTAIESIPEIGSFVLSSIQILIDKIKDLYQIQCNFDIKDWYIAPKNSEIPVVYYDLCIQTDLSTGNSHISNKYQELECEYQLVYLIDYTFTFMDKTNKRVLTLNNIADPCIDLISTP